MRGRQAIPDSGSAHPLRVVREPANDDGKRVGCDLDAVEPRVGQKLGKLGMVARRLTAQADPATGVVSVPAAHITATA